MQYLEHSAGVFLRSFCMGYTASASGCVQRRGYGSFFCNPGQVESPKVARLTAVRLAGLFGFERNQPVTTLAERSFGALGTGPFLGAVLAGQRHHFGESFGFPPHLPIGLF